MLFSSTIFLFAFLPIVFTLYFLLRGVRARNGLLLLASLFFYAWGETVYVALLLLSIGLNYTAGLWIDRTTAERARRRILAAAVSANLLILGAFKYAGFLAENLGAVWAALGGDPIRLEPIHLPIGISFFTFQALTYVVDVYRRDAPAQQSPLRVALYISLFPQLIAGPIVRYRQVANALARRSARLEEVALGIERFVIGLGKKVILANTLAVPADLIFDVPPDALQPGVAWLGIVCFALQIYFDFSGYSDMAIGLGRCFGFGFPENFDWPYLSRSIREFWRRWHISLSTWFRDYVYIPLGGNRKSAARTYFNLVVVFLLCGLWHGASWNFVIWGLIHGFFLVVERTRAGGWLARAHPALQGAYTLGVVLFAWVFFRADDPSHATAYLGAMAGLRPAATETHPLALYLNPEIITTLLAAGLCLAPRFRSGLDRLASRPPLPRRPRELLRVAAVHLVLVVCAMSLLTGTHNPFIYFRF